MPPARLLTIMGSGETAPTMVKTHRAVFERAGGSGVLLSTPYGFQENASEISARAVDYFRRSVGVEVEAVDETQLNRLRQAPVIFSGPGSPTFALRAWAGTPVPDVLADRLREGGCVTFASAAALTLGVATLPVYEIYKAGETPRWLDGLDLLAIGGLRAAVIPHFDNAEGGTHDTRYCYLGERRLAMLEEQLPEGAVVLGVDEHTACTLDLDAGSAAVTGLGRVTVRVAGKSTTFEAGETVPIAELQHPGRAPTAAPPAAAPAAPLERSPLLAEVERLERRFDAAVGGGEMASAVEAVVELEQAIHDWSGDTLQSDEPDRARAVLRSLVGRLGDAAATSRLPVLVEAVLRERERARGERRWEDADRLRDALVAAGIEVRDEAGGTVWRPC